MGGRTVVSVPVAGVANQFAVILVDEATGQRTIFFDRDAGLTAEPDEVPVETVKGWLDSVPGSGNVQWELFTNDGTGRVTMFTSAPTPERRPKVQSGDSAAFNAGTPEVLLWPAGSVVELDTVVTTATPSYSALSFIADQV